MSARGVISPNPKKGLKSPPIIPKLANEDIPGQKNVEPERKTQPRMESGYLRSNNCTQAKRGYVISSSPKGKEEGRASGLSHFAARRQKNKGKEEMRAGWRKNKLEKSEIRGRGGKMSRRIHSGCVHGGGVLKRTRLGGYSFRFRVYPPGRGMEKRNFDDDA